MKQETILPETPIRSTFVVDQSLPTLNEIIKASKRHWGTYATMKKKYNDIIVSAIIEAGGIPDTPHLRVDVGCVWHEDRKKRDPDNVFAGIKFILDAMVHAGIVANDTRDNINSIGHSIAVGDSRAVEVIYAPCDTE